MPVEPKAPKEYFEAPAVEKIAKKLLPLYHSELANAEIKYFFVTEHSKKGGRAVRGKARKLSGASQYLAGGFNFAIEVAMDLWNDMDEPQRMATMDHLLECCTGEEDDKTSEMKYMMREPDVREFSTILARHGAYTTELQGLVQVAKNIHIEERVQEIIDENENSDTVN